MYVKLVSKKVSDAETQAFLFSQVERKQKKWNITKCESFFFDAHELCAEAEIHVFRYTFAQLMSTAQ